MARKQIPHIRRWHPGVINGKLRVSCDCGWRGELLEGLGTREDLDRQFIEHIPPAERETYVLVDQTPSDRAKPGTEVLDESGNVISADMLPRGNWIMPAAIPCEIVRWYETGDEYRAVVRKFEFPMHDIDMLVGEIRLADGRVFALT